MTHLHHVNACFGAGLVVAVLAVADPAIAASQRTFVSTSGIDNPACSIVAPCRTFGAALPATLPDGEVIVLTSGGYGTVTITQSVSIIAPPGVYAGISVFSGAGVTVTTAATDVVTLRGLTINNVDLGTRGIVFNGAGRLQVADVSATGFTFDGLRFRPSASSELVVERSNFSESTEISFTGGNGVSVGDPNGTSALTIIGCTIVNNNTGVHTSNAAETRLAGTTISRNTIGIVYNAGGLAMSQGNNLIDGNVGNDGTAPTIVGAK